MAAGEGYYNDLEKDEDGNLNLTSSAANDAYVSTLITEGEGQGYKESGNLHCLSRRPKE